MQLQLVLLLAQILLLLLVLQLLQLGPHLLDVGVALRVFRLLGGWFVCRGLNVVGGLLLQMLLLVLLI